MLQKLNERIQGLVAWIIITLVALTFLLFGVDYYMQSHQESTVQVDVNSQPVTKEAVELNFRRARQSRDLSQINASNEKQLKQQLLNEMIVNEVSVQSARENGFEVSALQADNAVISIPQFQEDGHFSSGRYTQVLNSAFFTPESFRQEVRQGMLLNQQRYAFIGTSFAVPLDITQFVNLYMQTRDYAYLRIPAAQFLNQISIPERDIEAFYNEHKDRFLSPEKVSIDYVILSIEDIKKSIQISDSQLKNYYDENRLTIAKPFSAVELDIKNQLLAELAQIEFSKSLEKLTDLSYQTPDSLLPVAEALAVPVQHSPLFSREDRHELILKNKQVVEAAFSEDVLGLGNNSEPIQLDNDSVIVLRVRQHVMASERSLESVKSLIVQKLRQKQAELKAAQIGSLFLDNKMTLEKKANLLKDNKLTWIDVVNSGRDAETVNSSINELAFNLPSEGAKAGLTLENGDYIVVSLKLINSGKLDKIDKEQLSSITQQIEANYGVMEYELYMANIMKKATIVRY